MAKIKDEETLDVEPATESSHRLPHWRMLLDQGILTPIVEHSKYRGRGTEESPYAIEWIDKDPRNPMNWPTWYKWAVTLSMAFATLAVSLCSSMFSGGIEGMLAEFGTSQEVATLGLSLFVLGFALGPLIWAPLSELYGRQKLFAISFAGFVAFNAGVCGSQNMQTVIILRFFAGSFGSSPLTNAGGVIADMFTARERTLALSVFAASPFVGPALGPVIGGFMGETVGFRWILGVMAIFSAIVWIIGMAVTPETYAPVLLRQRAKALSKKTGQVYKSKIDIDRGAVTLKEAFKTGLSRPWILLFREPIILILSIYMAIIYGTLYMLFAAYPIVFQETRGWSPGIGGLAFIGILIGMMLAIAYSIFYENGRFQKVADKHDGNAPPEHRLPSAIVGGVALPIGLFWFAWTNYPTFPWEASVAAGIPFGFGMVLVFLSIMNYLIDSYTIFAASALAANSVMRSCFGAVFPLFTTYMYNGLGIHWASSIPAFLALACVPFPFLFYKYGYSIRRKCKYANEAEEFMQKLRQTEDDDDDESSSTAGDEKASSGSVTDEKDKESSSSDSADLDGGRVTAHRQPQPYRHHRAEDEAVEEFEGGEEAWARDAARKEQGERQPRFEEIKTGEAKKRPGSRRSRATSTYDAGPFDIDRVNTRDSFRSERSRSRSQSQSRQRGGVERASSRR